MSILSKYPIVEEYGVINRSGGVQVFLDGEAQKINFYTLHLGHDPYGPYDSCFDNMTVDEVLEREAESGRTLKIIDTIEALDENGNLDGADEISLLVVGDFNAPSQFDWTEDLAEKNCAMWDVSWPMSARPEVAGLIDRFRWANPVPVKVPGISWSPLFSWNAGEALPEPQDRINSSTTRARALT